MEVAEITRASLLAIQVCVPENWNDEDIKSFAEREMPCGTTNGWFVKENDERNPDYEKKVKCCQKHGFIHVVLEA